MTPITQNSLAAGAGVLISIILLLLPLIPEWKKTWDKLESDQRQAINIVALMIVTVIVALLSCVSDIKFVECTQLGLFSLVGMFASAALGNAITFVSLDKLAKTLTKSE